MLEIGSVIAAFSEDQVQRLTGLSKGRLRYWARTGFFSPAYSGERGPYSKFYSFKDVLALRTLELLRNKYKVPLQHLRQVAQTLTDMKDNLWTSTSLYVANRRVVRLEPTSGHGEEVVSGQKVMRVALTKVVSGAMREVEEMRRRKDEDIGRVVKTSSICHNTWVIAGTRIPVAAVRRLHEDGCTVDDIINEFPDLTPDDVNAALAYKDKRAA